ncbi:MAG: hypothetical protein J5589_06540 [Firmicutes bacterium]|nr:hypothetical protein [Bacillota bacterium]
MKKTCILFMVLCLLVLMLAGCGKKTSPEEILEKYASYTEVPSHANRVGIQISKGTEFGGKQSINISFTSEMINQDENNTMVLASRCRLYDAENPDVEIESGLLSSSKTTTTSTGVTTHTYEAALSYDKDVKCDYMLFKFEGVSADEAPELETPALFFIVSIEKDGSVTVLTDKPLADK